jgi:hypothetical protein
VWVHDALTQVEHHCSSARVIPIYTVYIRDINYHYFIVTDLLLSYTICHPHNEVINSSSTEELSATDICQMQQRITRNL